MEEDDPVEGPPDPEPVKEADPQTEDGSVNENVATEFVIEKTEESFGVSSGDATEESRPGIELDSIFMEEDDPVEDLSDFTTEKDAAPEIFDEAETEKNPESFQSNNIIPLVRETRKGKDPKELGKGTGVVEVSKKEETRQPEKEAQPQAINPKPFTDDEKETIKQVSDARGFGVSIFRKNKQNRTPGSKKGEKLRRAVWLIVGVLIVSGIVLTYRLMLSNKQTFPDRREKSTPSVTAFEKTQPVPAVKKAIKPKSDFEAKQPIAPPENSIPKAFTGSKDGPEPVADITTAAIQPTSEIEPPEAEHKTPVDVHSPILPPAGAYPYSIHATSYKSKEAAEVDTQLYRQMGLPSFWVKTDLRKKGVWYRVFCGYFKTAEAAQKEIKEKQLQGARPYPCRHANFIGTYSSESQLEKKRQELVDHGYSPYVIRQDNGNRFLFLGGYTLKRATEKFAFELSAKGIRSKVVKR
jgi:hypothetical protein